MRTKKPQATTPVICPHCGAIIEEPRCWCGYTEDLHDYRKTDHQFLVECPKCREIFNPQDKTKRRT